MQSLPLRERGETTVRADGTARVTLTPTQFSQTWRISGYAIKVSTAVSEPTGILYVNGIMIDNTYTASRNGGSGVDIVLRANEPITMEWASADVGAIAELTVYGTMEVR